MKKLDVFESAMSKIQNEFSTCSTVHADWEFVLTDKKTGETKNTKKFRMLAIQNGDKKYQHIAVIIPELSSEYVQIPDLVEKFLLQIHSETRSKDILDTKMPDMNIFQFTGDVYLYTDKLLISEDAIRNHFQKNNLVLQSRLVKPNAFL
ncbi:protein of unknown function [Nitrosotalea devaniterrae]|uniref:Uncharacterized protein n=1 Tax=Nitrosotalea devaniterrae TaxID=1078905 RepID=A0A128A3R6_9ARCH|nr:protein of unknown function [Candidatus Nitrosotalea devanaterra]